MDTITCFNYTYSNLLEFFRNDCHMPICVIVVFSNDILVLL